MDSTSTAEDLAARLAEGPPILIDGGTGTELERMGATLHETVWSARAALTDADILRRVHSAYLEAGAEIIIANTYSCNYHMMVSAGLAEEFDGANRRALELAKEVRDTGAGRGERPTWVAGSMSTTTLSTGLDQSVIAAADEEKGPGDGYRAQAQIIADVGVDLIMLEMMRDVTQTRLCLQAALETGLPVWLGFSVERSPEGELWLFGSQTPFKEGLERVLDGSGTPQAVGVMHSEIELTPEALEVVREAWDGPVYAYPHHGVFELPNWRFDNTLSPEEFAAAAMEWVRRGANAVGGCCGIRPAHIAALRATIDQAYR